MLTFCSAVPSLEMWNVTGSLFWGLYNVLLTADEPEHLYLTDFGVAKRLGAAQAVTEADHWVGTLDYIAPEQMRDTAVGAPADIYALAGLLYHCLTGEVPFPREDPAARMWAHVNAPPPSPSRRNQSLPPGIRRGGRTGDGQGSSGALRNRSRTGPLVRRGARSHACGGHGCADAWRRATTGGRGIWARTRSVRSHRDLGLMPARDALASGQLT